MQGRVQDLSFTKLVPNSAHKELADYWRKNGNVRGEVYVSERSRSRDTDVNPLASEANGSSDGPDAGEPDAKGHTGRMKTEAEMENRWRIELLHDGTIVGIEQGKGVKWHDQLPNVG
jgi:hypothetical protein